MTAQLLAMPGAEEIGFGPAGSEPTPQPASANPPAEQHRWISAAEAIALPTPQAIIEGSLWADSVTTIVAAPGHAKTFILLDQAAAVSTDLPWRGRRVRHGSVVYVAFEGHVGRRLAALREVAGHWLKHVYVASCGDPLSPLVDRDRVELPSVGELALAQELDSLADHLRQNSLPPIVLVQVDTVSASLTGSESSSECASAYLRAVRRLMTHTPGAAWELSHHAGWQDGEAPKRRERGSSAFRGNVDGTLFLEAGEYDRAAGTTPLTLTTLKVRDGERHPPLHLVLRRVEIPGAFNEWGEPLTSCVIADDQRTREQREAEQVQAAETETRALDLRVLKLIAERQDVTSQDGIRLALGLGRSTVYPAIGRLVECGWAIPPTAQRKPYTVSPKGREALQCQSS